MRTRHKRDNMDSRHLRTRTAPRTRLGSTAAATANARGAQKATTGVTLAFAIVAVIAVAMIGISALPNLLFAANGPSSKSPVQASTSNQKAQDGNARLQELLDSTDSDLLTLVNKWNAVPDDSDESVTAKGLGANTSPETRKANLVEIEGGHKVDARCKDDLEDMMEACRDAGNRPLICSAYRTKAEQQELFDAEVEEYIQLGYSEKYAAKRAGKSVALPGTSEHHLGLAIDVVDELNQRLDSTQLTSDTQTWMMKNSWKYGFILRYPQGKEEKTGIVFEPWHYRYLTRDVAREVHESGLCYEEFLEMAGASSR